MMINQDLVKLIGDRVLKGGINPKTNEVFKLEDIINAEYKEAVENYVIENSNIV